MSDEIQAQASQTEQGTGAEQHRTRWVLWLQWVLVSALGFVFAGSLMLGAAGPVVLGVVWALEAALWLLLWRQHRGVGWWLGATLIGLALAGSVAGFGVSVFFTPGFDPGVDMMAACMFSLVPGLALGLLVGLTHWLMLQGQVPHAGRWMGATVVAFFAGSLAALVAAYGLLYQFSWRGGGPAAAVSLATGGAICGAVSGAALNALTPAPSESSAVKRRPSLAAVAGVLLSWVAVLSLGWWTLAPPMNEQHLLQQCRLGRRNFSAVDLLGADLSGANLSGANLTGADLFDANLSRADLTGADLSVANLSGANLSDADLEFADLRGANLIGADLIGADLIGADLVGANLTRAWLNGAKLRDTDLYDADLRWADLSEANLSDADLEFADLNGAKVTTEQLARARTLKGATLPDGTVHE